jgi:hypothetical protein
MSYFAKLDNNIVVDVISASQDFVNTLDGTWVQTSYNGTIRSSYAGIGYTYDAVNDVFYPPKPHPSWVLNPTSWEWEAPVSYPSDGKAYVWDEASVNWLEINWS